MFGGKGWLSEKLRHDGLHAFVTSAESFTLNSPTTIESDYHRDASEISHHDVKESIKRLKLAF